MKKLLIIVMLIFPAMSVSAKDSVHELCTVYALTGEKIMQLRQQGVPMDELMSWAMEYGSIYQAIVRAAFETPRYSTKEYQVRAVSDFRTEVYKECIEGLK